MIIPIGPVEIKTQDKEGNDITIVMYNAVYDTEEQRLIAKKPSEKQRGDLPGCTHILCTGEQWEDHKETIQKLLGQNR